jgi:hypothetical protein
MLTSVLVDVLAEMWSCQCKTRAPTSGKGGEYLALRSLCSKIGVMGYTNYVSLHV